MELSVEFYVERNKAGKGVDDTTQGLDSLQKVDCKQWLFGFNKTVSMLSFHCPHRKAIIRKSRFLLVHNSGMAQVFRLRKACPRSRAESAPAFASHQASQRASDETKDRLICASPAPNSIFHPHFHLYPQLQVHLIVWS